MNTSKPKPDLLAVSSHGESKRILAQLEHGARPQAQTARANGWTIDGWTIGLFALLLLMCSVAWMMHDKTITPKEFRQSHRASTIAAPARVTPMQAEHGQPSDQAASIINLPAATASDAGAYSAVHGPRADVMPRQASAVPATRTVAAPHKQPASAPRASASSTPGAVPAPVVAHAGDTDVTLLAALVAHTNKPAAVNPERPRDVVERQEGDTTAQLLARCKQLGLIEGMLCRSRICSGRWEADAACRAPAY